MDKKSNSEGDSFEHSAQNGLLDSSYVRKIGYGGAPMWQKVALESITAEEESTFDPSLCRQKCYTALEEQLDFRSITPQ